MKLLKALALGLPILALVLYGLAFAISRERRRTLLRAGISLMSRDASAGSSRIVAGASTSTATRGRARRAAGRGARALYNTVLSDLRLWFELAAARRCARDGRRRRRRPLTRRRSGQRRHAPRAGGVTDEVVGASATSKWVAANKPVLRTVTVILGLLLVLDSHHITARGSSSSTRSASLLVLGLIEILARPGRRPGARRSGVP